MNYIAILVAGLAGWIWGAAYYGVLGKPWMRAQGINPEDCKGKKMPLVPMALAFISALILAFAMACLLLDFEIGTIVDALEVAVAAGIAFIVTTTTVNNAFQGKKPMLTLIDSVHWLGLLMVEAVVLMLFP